jgi:hypothetical protein
MSKNMLFITDAFSMENISFEGVESSTLPEGKYVAIIRTAEPTTSEDKAERFKEKTPQLIVILEANGKTIKKWFNLVAYKRYDAKELKDVLEVIGKDAKLLKSVGQTAQSFAKLTLDEKIECCFDSMQADENDPEGKVHYAIFKGNGHRIIDADRSKKALSILGRAFVLAGAAESGEKLTGDDAEKLVGCEVGINITKNNSNQLKVEFISADEVSDL